MDTFGDKFRNLLIKKAEEGKLGIPIIEILGLRLNYHELEGEYHYFIYEDFFDRIPDDIKVEIEELWLSLD